MRFGELLGDPDDAVRRAAIVALGSLGRRACIFQEDLLKQLTHTSPKIRFAALTTLGGLQAIARPNADSIAMLLHDDVAPCQSAAVRALRCIDISKSSDAPDPAMGLQ